MTLIPRSLVLIAALPLLTLSARAQAAAEKPATAPAAKADPVATPYAAVLSEGLNLTVETVLFPQGEIQVLDENSGSAEDQAAHKFSQAYLTTFLKKAEAKGLLEITEPEKKADAPPTPGSKRYLVKATQKLLELSDKSRNTDKWLQVTFGKAEVSEILKEIPYPGGPASEDYRLIVGKFNDIPNAAAKELKEAAIASYEPRELKFRALLKYNLFTKSYSFVTADFGELDQENWITNFIK